MCVMNVCVICIVLGGMCVFVECVVCLLCLCEWCKCRVREMQTKAPLIQDIMGCVKITLEIFALGSGAELCSTLGSWLR